MKKIQLKLPTVLAIAFTVAILLGSFIWFTNNTDEMIEATTRFYLETNARAQASAFNTKLANQIELLQVAAQHWTAANLENDATIRAGLQSIGTLGNYTRLAVAGADGTLVDSSSKTTNVAKAAFFQQTMAGNTTISDSVQLDSEHGEYLYVTVPILQDEAVIGVMYGQFPLSDLSDLIMTIGFQETSASLLLSSDGTVIARSSVNELVSNRIMNFYDIGTSWGIKGKSSLANLKFAILDNQTITMPYKTGSRERLAILTPVGRNNWYYAIVISQDVIHRQSHSLSANLLVVELAISIAFTLLLISILYILHHTSIIEQTNDRFRMVSTQTQAIVFDYDFQKQHLELNGNVKAVMKEAKENFSGEEIERLFKTRLHENDRSVLQDIKHLRENAETSLLREMRILCADNNYYWHRLTATVVRDSDHKPVHLVGNLVNVEDEVTKELQLKQKAEIDPLSGLLNKGAFTSYVSTLLESSSDEDLYAFYIIDLDNFKKVNDTLGHMVGDRVITDVAQKLCTVFSENDYVGRIGGDEFAAFLKLSGSGKQMGRKIIESKANATCALVNEVYSDGENEVNITSSIGVSIYPKDGKKFEELYKNADGVLYKSKYGGKNQYNICE